MGNVDLQACWHGKEGPLEAGVHGHCIRDRNGPMAPHAASACCNTCLIDAVVRSPLVTGPASQHVGIRGSCVQFMMALEHGWVVHLRQGSRTGERCGCALLQHVSHPVLPSGHWAVKRRVETYV